MIGSHRHLASAACLVLGGLLAVRDAAAQTRAEGWSGQVQCGIASRGIGYQDDQTHTWVLSGPPLVRNDFRDYPATWTLSGSGRRTQISARAAAAGGADSWTYGGSDPGASITVFVPVGTNTIRIAGGQRAVKAAGGITGTAGSMPFSTDAGEWRFQFIDVVNGTALATLSGSRTQARPDLAGWRPPPGTTVTETCTWNLARSGFGSASGADAKTPASLAPSAGGAAARIPATTRGEAPSGAAAGAAAAASTGGTAGGAAGAGARAATTGGGAPAGAAGATSAGAASAAASSGSAGAAGTAASSSSAGAGPAAGGAATSGTGAASNADVTRQYAVLGLAPAPGTAVVVATLVDDSGAPLVGASIADIRLLDASSLPVGLGPYIVGVTGDIVDSSTLSVTTAFNGVSRAAFLDVPVGKLTLTVIYSRDGKVVTRSAPVVTTAGALATVQH